MALAASSDFPEAVEVVTRLYDRFGFDTVDNSPLSESWRTRPDQPAWKQERQTRFELAANIAKARRPPPASGKKGPNLPAAALSPTT